MDELEDRKSRTDGAYPLLLIMWSMDTSGQQLPVLFTFIEEHFAGTQDMASVKNVLPPISKLEMQTAQLTYLHQCGK